MVQPVHEISGAPSFNTHWNGMQTKTAMTKEIQQSALGDLKVSHAIQERVLRIPNSEELESEQV